MSGKVGIILINYQDYATKYLVACLASINYQTYKDYQVYIIDNASSPESLNYLKTNCSSAVILTRTNGNYAAANNLGIAAALKDGCQYIVIANMDTEFDPDWLRELIGAVDSDEKIGLAQSKIFIYPKNEAEKLTPKINSVGNVIHFLGFGYTKGYGQTETELATFLNSKPYPEIKGYASGCSLIIKAEALAKIKGYNEEYYMYHDDLELSLKARLAGYKIVLAPKSIVYHKYEFKRSVKMIYYMERNRYLFILSYYPWYLIILLFPTMLVMDFGLLFYSIINGWFKEEGRVYKYYFKASTYRKIFKERRELKKIRIIPFRQIARDFAGRIDFQEINNPILKFLVNPIFNFYWNLIRRIV